MAEVAAVTVGADISGEQHAADLSLVAWVPYHRSQLFDPMRKLAVPTVRTLPSLLPLVAQLRFPHSLVVHV